VRAAGNGRYAANRSQLANGEGRIGWITVNGEVNTGLGEAQAFGRKTVIGLSVAGRDAPVSLTEDTMEVRLGT
jgi:hypothetical protein